MGRVSTNTPFSRLSHPLQSLNSYYAATPLRLARGEPCHVSPENSPPSHPHGSSPASRSAGPTGSRPCSAKSGFPHAFEMDSARSVSTTGRAEAARFEEARRVPHPRSISAHARLAGTRVPSGSVCDPTCGPQCARREPARDSSAGARAVMRSPAAWVGRHASPHRRPSEPGETTIMHLARPILLADDAAIALIRYDRYSRYVFRGPPGQRRG